MVTDDANTSSFFSKTNFGKRNLSLVEFIAICSKGSVSAMKITQFCGHACCSARAITA